MRFSVTHQGIIVSNRSRFLIDFHRPSKYDPRHPPHWVYHISLCLPPPKTKQLISRESGGDLLYTRPLGQALRGLLRFYLATEQTSTPKTVEEGVETVCSTRVLDAQMQEVRAHLVFACFSRRHAIKCLPSAVDDLFTVEPYLFIFGPALQDSVALRRKFRGREGPSMCRGKS